MFPHREAETTPLALRSNLEFNHVLHERVVIVSIVNDYFLSVLNLEHAGDRRRGTLRNRLFVWLERNQADRTEVFHLPPERTIVMGAWMEF